ncbi:MAG: DinB family protein [bacterium]|nr:DinB family protein [bacterium]
MRIVDSILTELEREAVITRRVLERIPEDKLGWKPHEKSFSVGDLAWHIALTPGQSAELAKPDVFVMTSFEQPATPESKGEILDAFASNIEEAKQYLDTLDDAGAGAEWKIIVNGKELVAMPRVEFLRTIMMNHTYHHRGQLSVYLRLLDVPVPSIYGRSADEDPWGMDDA